jgi:hypothetical protein
MASGQGIGMFGPQHFLADGQQVGELVAGRCRVARFPGPEGTFVTSGQSMGCPGPRTSAVILNPGCVRTTVSAETVHVYEFAAVTPGSLLPLRMPKARELSPSASEHGTCAHAVGSTMRTTVARLHPRVTRLVALTLRFQTRLQQPSSPVDRQPRKAGPAA